MAWSRSKSGGGVDGRKYPAVGQLDADGVPGEEHPAQRVVQPDMVLGVAGRVHRDEGASGADRDLLAVVEHVEALGRRRVEAAVEGVEQRPVDAGRRVDEPRRVGQVPRPLLVHVHGGRGEGTGHVAHAAGVVEVDVRDSDPGQLGGADADLAQRGQQHGHRGLASGLDQHGAGPSMR